jgi:hypothetical protein
LKSGETSNQYIAWSSPTLAPYNPTPLVYGDYYYTLLDRGLFLCHDARTGKVVYDRQRITTDVAGFSTSPYAYNGRVFATSEEGDTYVIQAGPEFKVLGKNSLGEMILASPAIARWQRDHADGDKAVPHRAETGVIRLVFGDGTLVKLPELANELGFTRALVVADRGIVATGQVARVLDMLRDAGIGAHTFHDFDSNPDDRMVEAGRVVAAGHRVDSIVAIGGGSSLDCAKGINFVLTNGGTMRDYWGFAKRRRRCCHRSACRRPRVPAARRSRTR